MTEYFSKKFLRYIFKDSYYLESRCKAQKGIIVTYEKNYHRPVHFSFSYKLMADLLCTF